MQHYAHLFSYVYTIFLLNKDEMQLAKENQESELKKKEGKIKNKIFYEFHIKPIYFSH